VQFSHEMSLDGEFEEVNKNDMSYFFPCSCPLGSLGIVALFFPTCRDL
jgi:hypothetical protein